MATESDDNVLRAGVDPDELVAEAERPVRVSRRVKGHLPVERLTAGLGGRGDERVGDGPMNVGVSPPGSLVRREWRVPVLHIAAILDQRMSTLHSPMPSLAPPSVSTFSR